MLLTVSQRIKESYMSDLDIFDLVVTVWHHKALPCDAKYQRDSLSIRTSNS